MWKARLITSWAQVEEEGTISNTPQVFIDHPMVPDTGANWTDVTAQWGPNIPLDPNLFIVEATLTDGTLDAIAADPNYITIWSEQVPEEEV